MGKRYNQFYITEEYAIMIVKHKDKKIKVLIDKEDILNVISVGSWHGVLDKTLKIPSFYIAHRYNNKIDGKGVIKLHRLVSNCPDGMVVDHINHDTLDNRKQNLRICTVFENQQNLRSKKTEQTGVYYRYYKNNGKWCANITKNKKRYYKEFKTKDEAIKWRKEQEIKLYNYKGVI